MEKPLLSGESSGGRAGFGPPEKDRGRVFGRRSDAIAHGSPYEKAAALVDLVSSSFILIYNILH